MRRDRAGWKESHGRKPGAARRRPAGASAPPASSGGTADAAVDASLEGEAMRAAGDMVALVRRLSNFVKILAAVVRQGK